MGPDYHKPGVQIPDSFKEGADWHRAQAKPQESISSTWWRVYQDDKLTQLVEPSLKANQSIVAAEAAYRVALATVQANTAGLFPVVTAWIVGLAHRPGTGAGAAAGAGNSTTSAAVPGVYNTVAASVSASWELDLWGEIRRQIESAKASAQATDAQLAGERLSIAASVAIDYFELRQADIDIQSLKQQQDIDAHILEMTRATFLQGRPPTTTCWPRRTRLSSWWPRTRDRGAGRRAAGRFRSAPGTPPMRSCCRPCRWRCRRSCSSWRYDVVSAERTAASANARIGAADAAFFPTLTLSAEGGYQHNTFAHLFSLPNRFWTLGPTLAETIFDGGARTAAVREAEASYDEDVANYRNTVLAAFQNVETACRRSTICAGRCRLMQEFFNAISNSFASARAQLLAGSASEEDLLTQQLTLLQAEQNLKDTQALLTQGSVTLIKNLGGGWQWDDAKGSAVAGQSPSPDPQALREASRPPSQ